MDVWYIPVINAERLVEQTGAVTNALVNMTPLLANLSTCGVSISVSPYEEKLADISSMIIQSILVAMNPQRLDLSQVGIPRELLIESLIRAYFGGNSVCLKNCLFWAV